MSWKARYFECWCEKKKKNKSTIINNKSLKIRKKLINYFHFSSSRVKTHMAHKQSSRRIQWLIGIYGKWNWGFIDEIPNSKCQFLIIQSLGFRIVNQLTNIELSSLTSIWWSAPSFVTSWFIDSDIKINIQIEKLGKQKDGANIYFDNELVYGWLGPNQISFAQEKKKTKTKTKTKDTKMKTEK